MPVTQDTFIGSENMKTPHHALIVSWLLRY